MLEGFGSEGWAICRAAGAGVADGSSRPGGTSWTVGRIPTSIHAMCGIGTGLAPATHPVLLEALIRQLAEELRSVRDLAKR